MTRGKRILLRIALLIGAAVLLCLGVLGPCWSAWILDGMRVPHCPAGRVRPVVTATVQGVGREDWGNVYVGVAGNYLEDQGGPRASPVRRFTVTLTAVDPDGKETELKTRKGWDDADTYDSLGQQVAPSGGAQMAQIKLPAGPDGDWTLKVQVDSPAGDATAEVKLPVYAPALAHVLTDAPLYKPGQTLRFRAVLLHEGDLTPLAGRPGRWLVTNPDGELVLEEKARTSPMGVAASTFPVDPYGSGGSWRVRFESGAAGDEATAEVREFQLPRFTVEASSERRWWRAGERPVVSGTARYTSGAPVRAAPVRVVLSRGEGEWPPPPAWLQPRALTTDADGRFHLLLDPVPGDLVGNATLRVGLEVIDESGAVARGGTSVRLARDEIVADAVTELTGGMVPDANNRVFVRVTTPDGEPLRGTTVRLQKEWDPDDAGVASIADADGVARFQIDPGQPTTVVVPALPVRPAAVEQRPRVELTEARDLVTGESVDVEGRARLDRWLDVLGECDLRVPAGDDATVTLLVRLGADGGVVHPLVQTPSGDTDPLTRCVTRLTAGQRGPAGRARLWRVGLRFHDPPIASLTATVEAGTQGGSAVQNVVDTRLRDARPCVGAVDSALEMPNTWIWEVVEGAKTVSLTPVATPGDGGVVDATTGACVAATLRELTLDKAAAADAAGVLRIRVRPPPGSGGATPEPTTFPGFAIKVSAVTGERPVGTTVMRLRPGAIPPLRLRFSEILVNPGATVELAAIRGPGWHGDFPKKLDVLQGDRKVMEFPFDPVKRIGSFTLPTDVQGFVTVSYSDARAMLYVRPTNDLAVTLTADKEAYAPGDMARISVSTKDPTGPVPSGVTLSGVDATLAALAPLPGPDAFARVVVRATSDTPAFGVMDARALQTGQIHGENAAQAAVLRVSTVPSRAPGAARASGTGASTFDRDGEVTDAFYRLYSEVRGEVRTWEATAAADALLTPPRMVEIWEAALKKHPAEDPFGNPLHLQRLPRDLLALTDPRYMASDGARLPEDVEDWTAYVAREAP